MAIANNSDYFEASLFYKASNQQNQSSSVVEHHARGWFVHSALGLGAEEMADSRSQDNGDVTCEQTLKCIEY